MTRRSLFAAVAGLFGVKAAPTPIWGGIHYHGALSDAPSGCFLIRGDGTLSASALADLNKWGLSTRDFTVNSAALYGYKGGAE